jgi:nicotinamide-nucleotide amidase
MWPPEILLLAERVLSDARAKGLKIVTAESCTGGLVAAALTEIAGASDVFERGFVSYANEAKMELLEVSEETLRAHGAVSQPAVRAMAEGALNASPADVSVAVTGIAGPGGGTQAKPIGLVYFAAARNGVATTSVESRFGDIGRHEIRMASVKVALTLLRAAIADQAPA